MPKGLEIRAVTKVLGEEKVVDDVDLDLQQGGIHALVGLNGAGKTTLMNMMVSLVSPDSGTITYVLEDGDIPVQEMRGADWSQVGHFIGSPFTYPELTVQETLTCSALLQGYTRSHANESAQRMLERFSLTKWAPFRTSKLSLGNVQRLGLACAFVCSPTVVILDEPTNALDPAGVLILRQALLDTVDAGGAVLVSSHHLDEVARVASQISVMNRGRIIGELNPDQSDLERAFFAQIYRDDERQGQLS